MCQPILQRQTLKRIARGHFQEILTSVTCSTSALMPDAVQSTTSNEIQNAKWKHRNIKAPKKLPWCHVIRSTIHDDEDEAVTRLRFAIENKIGFCKWKPCVIFLESRLAGSLGPNLFAQLYLYCNCIAFVFAQLSYNICICTLILILCSNWHCTYPIIALLDLTSLLSFYIITCYQYFIYLLLFYHSILYFIIAMFDISRLIWTVHLESSHCASDARKPHCVPGSGWLWGARERDFFRNHKMDLLRKLKWIRIYPSHKGHH